MTPQLQRALVAALLAALLAACASDPDRLPPTNPLKGGKSERELRLEADGLYKLARRSLDTADFQGALQRYSQILTRFPFTDYATQAQLESVYARYRSFDPDGALAAADRFIKEHPRHPAIDYVHYLKGLINFQRGDTLLDWMIDPSRHDVGYARSAFDAFALLLQRYPDSRYAADARLRMIHMRNRIAEHELSVVRYYVRRGAHVAAAKRAEKIIAEYPGAPALPAALALLESSYRTLGLTHQAEDARRLRAANPALASGAPVAAPEAPAAAAPPRRSWRNLFGREPDPIPSPGAPTAAEDFGLQPGSVVHEVSPTGKPAAGDLQEPPPKP